MDQTIEEIKQDKQPLFILENSAFDNESALINNFSFRWVLINPIKRVYIHFRTKSKFFNNLSGCTFLFPIIWFIFSILYILRGLSCKACFDSTVPCNVWLGIGIFILFICLSQAYASIFE